MKKKFEKKQPFACPFFCAACLYGTKTNFIPLMVEFQIADVSVSVVSPHSAWQQALQGDFPAALWRLPKTDTKHFLCGNTPEPRTLKIDFEELPMGFAISPFLNPTGEVSLFIEGDVYMKFNASNHLVADTNAQRMIASIEQARPVHAPLRGKRTPKNTEASTETAKHTYEALVQKATEAIKAEWMQKVVLSRPKYIELPDGFNAALAFDALCQAYPTAFVSLVYLPHLNQMWLGATPETLVSQDENGIFKTVSLAGTQAALDANGQPIALKNAQWTQKEIEEQALVSRYVIGCFKKIRVREYHEEGPKTVVAGNVMHLRTDYCVDTNEINFPQLGTVMLELLHPTSAVCGMPKAAALGFIADNEVYNREFYSGFLGPVNVENATNLFVNLRCMKIEANVGTLYAGAGITEDSNPAREYNETELKTQTLLRILKDAGLVE